jgi:hypothetical protein
LHLENLVRLLRDSHSFSHTLSPQQDLNVYPQNRERRYKRRLDATTRRADATKPSASKLVKLPKCKATHLTFHYCTFEAHRTNFIFCFGSLTIRQNQSLNSKRRSICQSRIYQSLKSSDSHRGFHHFHLHQSLRCILYSLRFRPAPTNCMHNHPGAKLGHLTSEHLLDYPSECISKSLLHLLFIPSKSPNARSILTSYFHLTSAATYISPPPLYPSTDATRMHNPSA